MVTQEKRALDLAGFWMMLGLASLFGLNNVLIKLGNEGLQPVFYAGARSAVGAVAIWLWMRARGIQTRFDLWVPGLLMGLGFSAEFLGLFIALEHTSVVRASSLFYAMPIWLAAAAHFLFPGERLTPTRFLGFLLGFAGVVVTLAGRANGLGDGSLMGDIAAVLAGMSWASLVIVSRMTRIGTVSAEAQLLWQTVVSAVVLLALAPLYGGNFVRNFDGLQVGIFLFQSLGVVAFGFVVWFWLIGQYKASTVASFSFLTPVLSALLGWLVLGEPVSATTPIALGLLVAGLFLINRRKAS